MLKKPILLLLLIFVSSVHAQTYPTTSLIVNSDYWISPSVTDFGAAINTVLAACPTVQLVSASQGLKSYASCTIHLPAVNNGNWATTALVQSPAVSIIGAGPSQSTFTCTVNGDCLQVFTSPFATVTAGVFSGFQLSGSGTANGVGIHMGEVQAATWENISLLGFAGASGVGLWLDNKDASTWTERDVFRNIWFQDNTKQIQMTVDGGFDSFGYNRFEDIKMNVNSNQYGLYLGPEAQFYNGLFRLNVNATSAKAIVYLASSPGNPTALQGELHLVGEGTTTYLFQTGTSLTFLNPTSDSGISWGGTLPANSIGSYSGWIFGCAQGFPAIYGQSVACGGLPLVTSFLETPMVVGTNTATIAAGSNSGGSATATCFADGGTCTSTAGLVSLTTGTSPSAGQQVTITWPATPSVSRCTFTPNTAAAYNLGLFAYGQSKTGIQLYSVNAPAPSTNYRMFYTCSD